MTGTPAIGPDPVRTRAPLAGPDGDLHLRSALILAVFAGLLVAGCVSLDGEQALSLAANLQLHTFLETCSIIVCVLVFVVSGSDPSPRVSRNLALLGTAFLGVGVLDFMHSMSFIGLSGLDIRRPADHAASFWLAARLLAAGALMMVAFTEMDQTVSRRFRHLCLLAVGAGVAAAGWLILSEPDWFPRAFAADGSSSMTKRVVEAVVVGASCAAAFGFHRQIGAAKAVSLPKFRHDPYALMLATAIMAGTELCFALQSEVDGLFNVLGHVLKVISAWFIYRGLVAVNLRDLETQGRLALAAGDLGVWSWTAGTGAIAWDQRALTIFGFQPQDHAKLQDIDALVDPEDLPAKQKAWSDALDPAGDRHYGAVFRLTRPGDGKRVWISSTGQAEFVDGKPVRIVGIAEDITRRRQSEEALRQSEARISGILEIAADAIIAIDDEQRMILFNDGAEAVFGYRRAEVIGEPLSMLLPDRYRVAHVGHVEDFGASATVARRMAQRSEILALHKSGREFPAEASISKLMLDGRRTFTVVLRDVSERKRSEALLAETNAELERRVAERTSELSAEIRRREQTEAQLVRTQRMEAFGQLTGGVAHDFNNLLTVISGNLELLDMRLQDEKERVLLARAQDAAQMGARLTSRLLTFARRRQLETMPLNLNEQIITIVELLQRSLGEHIDLTTRLEPKLWTVRADPSEIENAILNLAINARDAMPMGGRLIIETANVIAEADQIGAITRLPAGEYVRVSVTDNGTGMTSDVLQRAFEPFFTTKPPGRGTGLGLSTIYGFAQQLGGTATIYSELGHGTGVNVYLPRADGEHTVGGDAKDEQLPVSAGETVLVVEDNADVREVTRKRLEGLGYRVIEVDNGQAAIDRVKADTSIDVVFSDVVMPGGKSGLDVARWLRTEKPGTPILLTSGYVDEALRGQGSDVTSVKLLRKPYSRAELARALRQVIDGAAEGGPTT